MIDRYLIIFGVLIAIFLIVRNRQGFDSAIRGIGALNIASIGAFQGNCIDAFGVQIGGCYGSRPTGGPGLPQGSGSDPNISFGDIVPDAFRG
jgi:hypothetical protein